MGRFKVTFIKRKDKGKNNTTKKLKKKKTKKKELRTQNMYLIKVIEMINSNN